MDRRNLIKGHYVEVKLTVHIRGISHKINRFLFKGPLNSQPFKGQIMCQRLSNASLVTYFVNGKAWIWTQSVQLQSPIHRIRNSTQVLLEDTPNRVVLTIRVIFIARASRKVPNTYNKHLWNYRQHYYYNYYYPYLTTIFANLLGVWGNH